MQVRDCRIEGPKIIEPMVFGDDRAVGVIWPLDEMQPQLSDKDRKDVALADVAAFS